jgi:hypothetical protein
MGLCHLKQGHEQAARRWLARAQAVAATDAAQGKYSRLLDTLR